MIRIGIHWGEVVERAGDVFGNTVNIASRLQAAAMGGTTCISQGLYKMVADWIHANDLGMIRAKGLRDPIHTWEPTEVALGLPTGLDPLRKSRGAAPQGGSGRGPLLRGVRQHRRGDQRPGGGVPEPLRALAAQRAQ